MRSIYRMVMRLSDILATVTSIVARLMLVAVTAITFLQVILRFAFDAALPWPEQAAQYLMIWLVLLAGSLLVKDEQLVRVDFFDHLWAPRLLTLRNAFFRLLLVILLAILAWEGWGNAIFGLRRISPTMDVSYFWFYLAVPVGALLMMFHMFALALRDLIEGTPDTGTAIPEAEI